MEPGRRAKVSQAKESCKNGGNGSMKHENKRTHFSLT
jgi:hypothetical protein